MTTFTATYSPEDNKLRLYASQRLDAETYARVKAAGFKWAPKQDLFVAPMWTPGREDLLIELAGEIDDEDTSLVDRAEERSDRFDGYRAKRTADSERAHAAVAAIVEHIPLGQPILVGHHSERHARKDKERIDNGMRKAVKMWETASYWKARAAGALAHAKYKELPTVRARRIKGIETDLRRMEREDKERAAKLALWSREGITLEQAREIANYTPFVCAKGDDGSASGMRWTAWDVLRPDDDRYKACPSWTVEQVRARALEVYSGSSATRERWREHYKNRIAYERAMLEEQGATALLDPKPRRVLPPILNYRSPTGTMQHENRYNRGELLTLRQVDMTAAEYAKIYTDYTGTAPSLDKSHRFRVAMIRNHERVAVYITDSKDHGQPTTQAAPEHPAARIPDPPAPTYRAPSAPDPMAEQMAAMRQTLRAGGVQTVVAPQLFPTPPDLAARMVEAAGIETGHRVLEPSAGTGALIDAMPADVHIVACEINNTLARSLNTHPKITTTIECDFLDFVGDDWGFDRIVMNPPFKDAADIKHVENALRLLKPGGRLVAICANGSRQRAKLLPLAETSGGYWEDLPDDTFKEQGTGVRAALVVIEGPSLPKSETLGRQSSLIASPQPDLFG